VESAVAAGGQLAGGWQLAGGGISLRTG
jgi:hypothetical protein